MGENRLADTVPQNREKRIRGATPLPAIGIFEINDVVILDVHSSVPLGRSVSPDTNAAMLL
jgi:hypothetical protein